MSDGALWLNLVLCLALIAAVPLAWRILRDRPQGGSPMPWCADCGYSLYGAASSRCPECGGTRKTWTSSRGRGSRVVVFVAVWAVIGIVLSGKAASVLDALVPKSCWTQAHFRDPDSAAYVYAVIRWHWKERRALFGVENKGAPPISQIGLDFYGFETGTPAVHSLGSLVLVSSGSAASPDLKTEDGVGTLGRCTTAQLLDYMQSIGITGNSPEVRSEAGFLLDRANELARTGRLGAQYPNGPFNEKFGGRVTFYPWTLTSGGNWVGQTQMCLGLLFLLLGTYRVSTYLRRDRPSRDISRHSWERRGLF